MHRLHVGEVDHETTIHDSTASDVVPAATNGDLQPLVPSQCQRVDHISDTLALGDDARMLVDEPVVNTSGLVKAVRFRSKQPTGKGWGQLLKGGGQCRWLIQGILLHYS